MSATTASLKAPNGGHRQDDALSESVASRRSDAVSAAPADETPPSARPPRAPSDGLGTYIVSVTGSDAKHSSSQLSLSVWLPLSRPVSAQSPPTASAAEC